jgi:hypothetical protein
LQAEPAGGREVTIVASGAAGAGTQLMLLLLQKGAPSVEILSAKTDTELALIAQKHDIELPGTLAYLLPQPEDDLVTFEEPVALSEAVAQEWLSPIPDIAQETVLPSAREQALQPSTQAMNMPPAAIPPLHGLTLPLPARSPEQQSPMQQSPPSSESAEINTNTKDRSDTGKRKARKAVKSGSAPGKRKKAPT